jgi:hypothetical protein
MPFPLMGRAGRRVSFAFHALQPVIARTALALGTPHPNGTLPFFLFSCLLINERQVRPIKTTVIFLTAARRARGWSPSMPLVRGNDS